MLLVTRMLRAWRRKCRQGELRVEVTSWSFVLLTFNKYSQRINIFLRDAMVTNVRLHSLGCIHLSNASWSQFVVMFLPSKVTPPILIHCILEILCNIIQQRPLDYAGFFVTDWVCLAGVNLFTSFIAYREMIEFTLKI